MKQDHKGIGDIFYAEGNINVMSSPEYNSTLSEIISLLSQRDIFSDSTPEEPTEIFDISEKISFNHIVKYKSIFEEIKIYHGKLNSLYEELEDLGSNRKHVILTWIKRAYLDEKNKVVPFNADTILDNVINKLYEDIIQSSNNDRSIEEVRHCLDIVILDAFIRCKILEKPSENL